MQLTPYSGMLSQFQNLIEGANTPMGSNGPHSKLTFLDDTINEG